MKKFTISLFTIGLLAGCGSNNSGEAPTGQVAATIDGDEITVAQVRMELSSQVSDPAFIASQQQAALQAIINRKLVANAAVKQGLDRTPAGSIFLEKARDLALISLMEQSLRAKTAAVSKDEAAAYVRDNPAVFNQRRIVAVDQLSVPALSPDLLKQVQPLESLEQIVAVLSRDKARYSRSNNVIDPLSLDPVLARRIAPLNVGDVFIVPQNGGATIARIRETSAQPIVGEKAVEVATRLLAEQRGLGQVNGAFAEIIKAEKAKVNINKAYQAKASARTVGMGADDAGLAR